MISPHGTDLSGREGALRTRRLGHAQAAAVMFSLFAVFVLIGAVMPARASAALGKPTAKAPAGSITSATPTFSWSKVSTATRYELRVYDGSTQVLKKTGLTKTSWQSTTALPKNAALTWQVRAGNSAGSGAWSASLAFSIALSIGDAFQGGKIAYILQPTDPGYVTGQMHGLIAAPADRATGLRWYNGTYVATGATGTALGTGLANSDAIVAAQGAPATGYAAGWARAYRGGGYTDWYLPSKDELNKLFLNQAAIGGFGPNYYWSSSEFDAGTAWTQAFDLSSQYAYAKNGPSYVRAVRSF
jgi:hypothetical protein